MGRFAQLDLFDWQEDRQGIPRFEWLSVMPVMPRPLRANKRAQPGNLFLGFMPPDEVTRSQISATRQGLVLSQHIHGHFVPEDCLHISSVGVGRQWGMEMSKGLVLDIEESVRWLALKPFRITLVSTACFNGRDGQCAYVLQPAEGTKEMQLVHRTVGRDLASRLELPWRSTYQPHLTLLYSDARPAPAYIEPISWIARELLLIYSHVGESRYTILGRQILRE